MVQRYEFEIYHCNGGEVVASDNGEYVSYEDYAALKAKAEALLKEAAVIYSKYNDTIAPEFMDMQTLQELSDVL